MERGRGAADGGVVVLDGKALRGSGKTQLVGAIDGQSGRTISPPPNFGLVCYDVLLYPSGYNTPRAADRDSRKPLSA